MLSFNVGDRFFRRTLGNVPHCVDSRALAFIFILILEGSFCSIVFSSAFFFYHQGNLAFFSEIETANSANQG